MAQTATEHVERVEAEDRRDVALSLNGDDDAFARLVERHQASIGRRMWRFTRDAAAHRELAQDVFVNAYMGLKSYRGDGPFAHWLAKIAVRAGYAFWKRRRKLSRERSLDPETAARLTADPADSSPEEAAEVVHRILDRMPPRDRVVITLLHLEERGVAEVAELLGWSRGMVKVQAWRARAKLRKLLEDAGLA